MKGKDWKGGNYRKPIRTGNVGACAAKCLDDTKCRYYTHTKGKCYLKNDTAKQKNKKNHNGGVCSMQQL